jgi:hypothetical protein|tara:strand:- start:142 stop:597 length:456 start_codon:yes stop_codon:yes gene_type:complete
MAEKLSEHFTLTECCRSETAMRKGIDNNATGEELENLKRVLENVIEPVRVHYGVPFTLNSGYRCQELNTAIGSNSNSQHCKGQAIDFEIPSIDNDEVARWVMDNLDYDQLILEFYDGIDPNSGWIHVSYVSAEENRNESLVYDGKHYTQFE